MTHQLLKDFNLKLKKGCQLVEQDIDKKFTQSSKLYMSAGEEVIRNIGNFIVDLCCVLSPRGIQSGNLRTEYQNGDVGLHIDILDEDKSVLFVLNINLDFLEQKYLVRGACGLSAIKKGDLSEGMDDLFKAILDVVELEVINNHKKTYLAKKLC